MSLHVDYRPSSYKRFVGNSDIIEALMVVLKRKKPPSAFMFTGPAGSGKTTLGRIVAKKLKSKQIKELNAANDRGIDAIRELIESMRFAPLEGKKKIILLDEAHMLTKTAQEALLKALEEPPSYVHWIICTTNPEALKPTFKRRCHTYKLSALRNAEVQKLLKYILKKEKVKQFSKELLNKIVDISNGSGGEALKYLDMVIDMKNTKAALRTLHAAGLGEIDVKDISRILINFDMPAQAKWMKIRKILSIYDGDGESARRPILGYLRKVLLGKNKRPEQEAVFFMMEAFKDNYFSTGKSGLSMSCYAAVFGGEDEESTK